MKPQHLFFPVDSFSLHFIQSCILSKVLTQTFLVCTCSVLVFQDVHASTEITQGDLVDSTQVVLENGPSRETSINSTQASNNTNTGAATAETTITSSDSIGSTDGSSTGVSSTGAAIESVSIDSAIESASGFAESIVETSINWIIATNDEYIKPYYIDYFNQAVDWYDARNIQAHYLKGVIEIKTLDFFLLAFGLLCGGYMIIRSLIRG